MIFNTCSVQFTAKIYTSSRAIRGNGRYLSEASPLIQSGDTRGSVSSASYVSRPFTFFAGSNVLFLEMPQNARFLACDFLLVQR